MALYSVSLNRTLILSATVAVRAKNEEAAQARVEQMMSKGAFGTIAWQVTAPNVLEWWVARMLGYTDLRMVYERYGKYIKNRTRQDGARFSTALHKAMAKTSVGRL
jgi:hypothetical protein